MTNEGWFTRQSPTVYRTTTLTAHPSTPKAQRVIQNRYELSQSADGWQLKKRGLIFSSPPLPKVERWRVLSNESMVGNVFSLLERGGHYYMYSELLKLEKK